MGKLIYSSKKLKITARTRTCLYCSHPVTKVKGKGIYHCPACEINMALESIKRNQELFASRSVMS